MANPKGTMETAEGQGFVTCNHDEVKVTTPKHQTKETYLKDTDAAMAL